MPHPGDQHGKDTFMNKSESIAQLAPDLIKLQSSLDPLIKNAENPYFHSKYVDLTSLWQSVQPLLAASNFAVIQVGAPCEAGSISLETMLIHTSGEWISGELTLPLGKADPQGAGSAISYARRYGLSALLGLVAEDDDGETAMRPFRAPTVQAVPHHVPTQQAGTAKPPASPPVVPGSTGTPPPGPPAAATNEPLASEPQVRMMHAIANEANLNLELMSLSKFHVAPEQLTKSQAMAFIDELKDTAAQASASRPAATTTGPTKASAPQLEALAKIAKRHQVSIVNLIQQDFPELESPEQLTKLQASQLIGNYGTANR